MAKAPRSPGGGRTNMPKPRGGGSPGPMSGPRKPISAPAPQDRAGGGGRK